MYALMIPKAFNMFFIHLQRTLRPFSTTFIADLFFLNVLLITDFIIYFIPDICSIVLWYFISSPYYISSKLLWKMYYSLFLSFKNFNPMTALMWKQWNWMIEMNSSCWYVLIWRKSDYCERNYRKEAEKFIFFIHMT